MSGPESIADRYNRRAATFAAVIAAAPPDRWSSPSPCTAWTAADVLQHVLDMHATMFTALDRSLSPAPSVDADPLGAFNHARTDIERALADTAVAATTVQTPMGPSTLAEHVDGVASADLVVHGWDLARALGLEHEIDPAEVEAAWPGAQEMPDIMRVPEAFGPGIIVFGPIVEVPDDAPLQDRLLGLLGRDPHWEAP
jgi:uncharacterized protein (TIGR03086 family)